MAANYEWDDSNAAQLRDYIQSMHNGLVNVHAVIVNVIEEAENDPKWSGHHKNAFLSWMDLLKQYAALLADPSIGQEAVKSLDEFLANWAGYYDASDSFGTLRSVQ